MELTVKLKLPTEMNLELLRACRESNCSPKQFAAEALEVVLASRRLPHVAPGSHGPRIDVVDQPTVEAADTCI
jgi:hypothetical protein